MKAISIKNAPSTFANFLMAFCVSFRWSHGEYIIEDTRDAEKFISFMLRNGVRESDVNIMKFEVIEL